LPALSPYQTQKPNQDDNLPKRDPRPSTVVAAGDIFFREALSPDIPVEKKMALLDQARTSYQQAIRQDQNYLPAHMGLGRTYVAMDRLEQARTVYATALQIAPNNGIVYHDLAVVYLRAKNGEGALQMLQKAIESDPENRQYQNTLGWTLARLGRDEEAFTCFARIYPGTTAHCRVARMLKHMGQPDLARRHIEAALAADPEMPEARSLLATMERPAPQPSAPAPAPVPVPPTTPVSSIAPASYTPPYLPPEVNVAEEPQISKPDAPPQYLLPPELTESRTNRADIPPAPERPEPVLLLPPPPPTR
jgi:tetratricopeptide (TPR) repeat protein